MDMSKRLVSFSGKKATVAKAPCYTPLLSKHMFMLLLRMSGIPNSETSGIQVFLGLSTSESQTLILTSSHPWLEKPSSSFQCNTNNSSTRGLTFCRESVGGQ